MAQRKCRAVTAQVETLRHPADWRVTPQPLNQPIVDGVMTFRSHGNGEREPARKDKVCQRFHLLRLPDSSPAGARQESVRQLCLFRLVPNSEGKRHNYLSTPPHTCKSKQNPFDMAPDRVRAPNLNYHTADPSRAHLSGHPVPPKPALRCSPLLGCSPDALRAGHQV